VKAFQGLAVGELDFQAAGNLVANALGGELWIRRIASKRSLVSSLAFASATRPSLADGNG